RDREPHGEPDGPVARRHARDPRQLTDRHRRARGMAVSPETAPARRGATGRGIRALPPPNGALGGLDWRAHLRAPAGRPGPAPAPARGPRPPSLSPVGAPGRAGADMDAG